MGNIRHRDASVRKTLHRGLAFGNRQQRNWEINSRVRRQRPAQPGWKSRVVESDDAAMVQHRGLCFPGSRHVRKRGQKYSGRTRIPERERVATEEHSIDGARESANPCRSLQPLQSSKLQPAGQLPRLADFRPDHISTRSAAYSVWVEAVVLSHKKA